MQYKPIFSASLSIQTGINAKCPVLIISGTLSGIELRTGRHKGHLYSTHQTEFGVFSQLLLQNPTNFFNPNIV
jgi:hypothetical protein